MCNLARAVLVSQAQVSIRVTARTCQHFLAFDAHKRQRRLTDGIEERDLPIPVFFTTSAQLSLAACRRGQNLQCPALQCAAWHAGLQYLAIVHLGQKSTGCT